MDPFNTTQTPNFTYANDKYSCVREMWYLHVAMAYCVFITGIVCFITRVFDPLKWIHKWSGKLYIMAMLWCTATSLLVHNDGLPLGVLYSFLIVLFGLCFGWFVINLHQINLNAEATQRVQESIKESGNPSDLLGAINKEKGVIVNSKSLVQRMISLKALHGLLMFTSWMNIAGRIFASNQSGDFTCHTVPAYKQIDFKDNQGAGKPFTLVPVHDPAYERLPWANAEARWAVMMTFGPLVFAALVGTLFAFVSTKLKKKSSTGNVTPETGA